MNVNTLAWVCIWLFAAAIVAFAILAVIDSIREKRSREDDEAPKGYTGVHREGAVREPCQPPTWATALAEPSDALTEPTQAMPLVELRGEIGRHSSRQLGPVMRPDWDWTSGEWDMRNVEVFGVVDAT